MTVTITEHNRDRPGATASCLIPLERGTPADPESIPCSFSAVRRIPRTAVSKRMIQEPYSLDAVRRQVVLKSLQEVCFCRDWTLWAAHVRTNHVHIVTEARCKPEQVMTAMKAYSSRALNGYAMDAPTRRRWARHGSTPYLWTADSLRTAIHYVIREQGESMALFERSS